MKLTVVCEMYYLTVQLVHVDSDCHVWFELFNALLQKFKNLDSKFLDLLSVRFVAHIVHQYFGLGHPVRQENLSLLCHGWCVHLISNQEKFITIVFHVFKLCSNRSNVITTNNIYFLFDCRLISLGSVTLCKLKRTFCNRQKIQYYNVRF